MRFNLKKLALILIIAGGFLIFSSQLIAKELKVGHEAPAFTGLDARGQEISLSDFLGKMVVLYFYPKDDTPGCIIEAKGFSENYGSFQKKDVVVIGVSYDDLASHKAFKEKYQLPFYLIVDPDKKISQAYGTDGEFFADRQTFIINPEGKIQKIYYNVNPSGHGLEVLKDLTNPAPKE